MNFDKVLLELRNRVTRFLKNRKEHNILVDETNALKDTMRSDPDVMQFLLLNDELDALKGGLSKQRVLPGFKHVIADLKRWAELKEKVDNSVNGKRLSTLVNKITTLAESIDSDTKWVEETFELLEEADPEFRHQVEILEILHLGDEYTDEEDDAEGISPTVH